MTRSAPSNYLNQCWNIVNWTLRHKLQWNCKGNSHIFFLQYCIYVIWYDFYNIVITVKSAWLVVIDLLTVWHLHWNANVILIKFSALSALEVAKKMTSSDENFIKMTPFPIQCISMGKCKTDVTPWSYVFLSLTHWFGPRISPTIIMYTAQCIGRFITWW